MCHFCHFISTANQHHDITVDGHLNLLMILLSHLFIYLNNTLLLKALHMYLPRSSLSPILILSSPPPSPILVPGPHSPIVCVHGPCMMILPLKFAFRILTMPVHCCYHKLSLIYINSVTLNLGTFKHNSLPRHRMLSNHLILFVIQEIIHYL